MCILAWAAIIKCYRVGRLNRKCVLLIVLGTEQSKTQVNLPVVAPFLPYQKIASSFTFPQPLLCANSEIEALLKTSPEPNRSLMK